MVIFLNYKSNDDEVGFVKKIVKDVAFSITTYLKTVLCRIAPELKWLDAWLVFQKSAIAILSTRLNPLHLKKKLSKVGSK